MRDAEPLEGLGGGRLLVAHAVEAGEHAERLLDPEPFGQGEVAGGEADLFHGLGAAARQSVTAQLDGALVGGDGAQQHEQRGGLARAVGPEEADALAGRDGDADAIDGVHIAEALHQVAGLQDGFHDVGVSRSPSARAAPFRRGPARVPRSL